MTHWTRSSFQRLAGRSKSEVERLIALGLPHETVGTGRGSEVRIDPGAALAWLTAAALAGGAEGGEAPDLATARARLASVQAELTQVRLERERGELIPAALVSAELDRTFAAIRAKLLSLPAKLAPIFSPDDAPGAFRALQDVVHEMLAELARDDGDELAE